MAVEGERNSGSQSREVSQGAAIPALSHLKTTPNNTLEVVRRGRSLTVITRD